jgi:hypothetical protein
MTEIPEKNRVELKQQTLSQFENQVVTDFERLAIFSGSDLKAATLRV